MNYDHAEPQDDRQRQEEYEMETTALQAADHAKLMEQVIVGGDLRALSTAQRVSYYNAVCSSVGLNPLTRPFEYITLNNKLTLYARKDCTDQLRSIHDVSVDALDEKIVNDVCVVTCKVHDKTGRTDMAKGAVSLKGLQGEALANAIMKTETKAKRRATLSICGLGLLDESEVETIPGAVTVHAAEPPHDPETGEVHEAPPPSEPEVKLATVAQCQAIYVSLKAQGFDSKPRAQAWAEEQVGHTLRGAKGEPSLKLLTRVEASALIDKLHHMAGTAPPPATEPGSEG